jgi:hypothetical protein
MANAQRDPLRELALLVRAPEPGTSNLAAHAVENADVLGEVLHVLPKYLRGLEGRDDDEVAPRLRRWLEVAGSAALDSRQARRATQSLRAASIIGDNPRWTDGRAVLDVNLLLGDLLADRTRVFLSFHLPGHEITVERRTLADVTFVRRVYLDVVGFADADGLHFRWRGGRGGFNWKTQVVPAHQRDRVLDVTLRAPHLSPARGAWLGDVLLELGLLQ